MLALDSEIGTTRSPHLLSTTSALFQIMFQPKKNTRYKLKFEIHSPNKNFENPRKRVHWLQAYQLVAILPPGVKPWELPYKIDSRQRTTHLQASTGKNRFVVWRGRKHNRPDEILLVDYSTRPARFYGAAPSRTHPGKWAMWLSVDPQQKLVSKSIRLTVFQKNVGRIPMDEVQRLLRHYGDENPAYEVFLSADDDAIVGYDRDDWEESQKPKKRRMKLIIDSLFSWAKSKFSSKP